MRGRETLIAVVDRKESYRGREVVVEALMLMWSHMCSLIQSLVNLDGLEEISNPDTFR